SYLTSSTDRACWLMLSISQQVLFVRRQTRNYFLYTEAEIKVDEQNVLHSVKGEKENALTV
ncbi:hypothetical protein, partial [Cardiobacterium hominis]|uniref:hypothetical protein n=1 Tax=Cardiobacterium hominis TaxID=2718 RepID=UPI0028E8BC20